MSRCTAETLYPPLLSGRTFPGTEYSAVHLFWSHVLITPFLYSASEHDEDVPMTGSDMPNQQQSERVREPEPSGGTEPFAMLPIPRPYHARRLFAGDFATHLERQQPTAHTLRRTQSADAIATQPVIDFARVQIDHTGRPYVLRRGKFDGNGFPR